MYSGMLIPSPDKEVGYGFREAAFGERRARISVDTMRTQSMCYIDAFRISRTQSSNTSS
jgi:hypothetical protein